MGINHDGCLSVQIVFLEKNSYAIEQSSLTLINVLELFTLVPLKFPNNFNLVTLLYVITYFGVRVCVRCERYELITFFFSQSLKLRGRGFQDKVGNCSVYKYVYIYIH